MWSYMDLKSSEAISLCLMLVNQYVYGRQDGPEGSLSFTDYRACLAWALGLSEVSLVLFFCAAKRNKAEPELSV